MNTRSITRRVIELLTELSDNKEVQIIQNKHIKISGLYGGERRAFVLPCSPSSNYKRNVCAALRSFIRSTRLQVNPTNYSL